MLHRLLLELLPPLMHAAELVLAFVATYLLHSSLLIGVAVALTWRAMPWRLSLAAQNAAWKVALVGALLTSGAQSALSIAPLGGTWTLPRLRSSTHAEVAVLVDNRTVMGGGTRGAAPRSQTMVFASVGRGSMTTLLLATLLVGGAVAGGVALAVRRRRLAQLLARRVDGRHTVAGIALREVQRRSGFRRPVQLTVADRLATPAALSTDEICVPARMLAEFDPLVQECVLAHELAHIRHGDTVWLEIAGWLQAILPFQPLNRLARHRLREIAEFAADDWASAVTRQPVVLARALGVVAGWLAPREGREQPVAAMLHEGGSPLVRRVRRLTTADPVPLHGRVVALATGVVATVALLVFTAIAPRLDAGSATVRSVFNRVLITTTSSGKHTDKWVAAWRHAPGPTRLITRPTSRAHRNRNEGPART